MKITADGMKQFGNSELLCCPQCKNMVNMQVLKSSSGFGVFNVSLVDYQVELFTICPACGSIFAVDKSRAKEAGHSKSNKVNTISEAHLTFVKRINLNG